MSDPSTPKRSLSDISHLFLSSIREKQTGGAPRPVRRPPGSRADASIDLTPEEFAQVFGEGDLQLRDSDQAAGTNVTAVISAHLNGHQFDRVRQYARHLAVGGRRVGLIEVDGAEFRLMCFDCGLDTGEDAPAEECFEPRRMTEALEEMSWDVDHWLLFLPNPRSSEARSLLRDVENWVLLSTCDHDGVVSCYRALKGLSEVGRPHLSLALLEASDEATAGRVYRKLAGVCEQFLGLPLEFQTAVQPTCRVAEHVAMLCRPTRDKAALANQPQWQVVSDFLKTQRQRSADLPAATPVAQQTYVPMESESPAPEQHVADVVVPESRPASAATEAVPPRSELPADATPRPASPAVSLSMPRAPALADAAEAAVPEIIDLAGGDSSAAGIVAAVIAHASGELVESPVRAPACPEARLAVNRDRQLVLLAVCGQGLEELGAIGKAWRWLNENRALIAMATPQFHIDAHAMPRLQLLVDYNDVAADVLQPMLQSGHVTVHTYRKLRWGQKTGLLLEAA